MAWFDPDRFFVYIYVFVYIYMFLCIYICFCVYIYVFVFVLSLAGSSSSVNGQLLKCTHAISPPPFCLQGCDGKIAVCLAFSS